jgi:hypothetical protein
MSTTFPSIDAARGIRLLLRRTALPSLRTKLSVEIAVRHLAGRCCARSRFAGALK